MYALIYANSFMKHVRFLCQLERTNVFEIQLDPKSITGRFDNRIAKEKAENPVCE